MAPFISLLIISAFASSQGWHTLAKVTPGGGDSPVWACETDSSQWWTTTPEGALLWSCSRPAAHDSLLLSWSGEETGRGAAVHAVVDAQPAARGVSWEFEAVLRDGSTRPLSRHRHDGQAHEFGAVAVQASLPDGSRRIRIRVRTEAAAPPSSSIRFSALRVEGMRGSVSLIPIATVVEGQDCTPQGPGSWRLPPVPVGSWRVRIDSLAVPAGWVVEAMASLAPTGQSEPRVRILWREEESPSMQEAPARWVPGSPDTVVAMIEPLTGDRGAGGLCVVFDAGPGAVEMGPATIRARPRSPLPGEVVIRQVACAPAEAEFVEILNRLWWTMPTSALCIDIEDRSFRCGDERILPGSSIVVRRAGCPGFALPNERATISLRWDGAEIDRVAYGPLEPLPAPPHGWSLLRDSTWTVQRLAATPAALPPRVTDGGMDSLAFSELMLWPLESSERFVEIVNRRCVPVDLASWAVLCEDALVFPESTIVEPSGTFVTWAASFPKWFALNSERGEATLVDPSGRIKDRVNWSGPPPRGCSLTRAVVAGAPNGDWAPAVPTPGTADPVVAGIFQVEITVTADGRCIQWSHPRRDDLVFWVYRALLRDPGTRTRITVAPIGGSPPHSIVDIDASAEEDYLYWLGVVDASGEVLVGPFASARSELNLSVGPPSPNPFRDETSVPYSIRGLASQPPGESSAPPDRLHMGVYTLGGSLVRTLVSGQPREGSFAASWDGKDESGKTSPPGVYVVSVQIGTWVRATRVVFAGQ